MTHPAAKGERFLAVAGDSLSLLDVSKILRRRLGASASKAPRFQMPDWVLRVIALRDASVRGAVPQLGMIRDSTSAKAKRLLGWTPRSSDDAIAASGESLIK